MKVSNYEYAHVYVIVDMYVYMYVHLYIYTYVYMSGWVTRSLSVSLSYLADEGNGDQV